MSPSVSPESALDDVLQQRLEARRAEVSEWMNRFRVVGALVWLLFALLFRWLVPFGALGAYAVLGLALWVGARRIPALGRMPALGVALIDMPAIFVVQWFAVASTVNGPIVAMLTTAIYITLVVVVAMLVSSRVGIAAVTGLAITLEALLMRRAGRPSARAWAATSPPRWRAASPSWARARAARVSTVR
jgi:hypothetical protein